MANLAFDVLGVGSALVDLEYEVDDAFLRQHRIAKGHDALVDAKTLRTLAKSLEGQTPAPLSGGSAANTVAAVQGFGGRAFFAGRVASDSPGRQFLADLTRAGIASEVQPASEGQTGQCLILVTPDAERSMLTCLGVANDIRPSDIHPDALASARTLYIEGYLVNSPQALESLVEVRQRADARQLEAAVSLSDPALVAHRRTALERLLGNGVGLLFCNEAEALGWAGADRLDLAVAELRDIARRGFITLGAAGSLAFSGKRYWRTPAVPVTALDSTGAGDIYAGACLHGLAVGMDERTAARFGNHAAATLVQRFGARLARPEDYLAIRHSFR